MLTFGTVRRALALAVAAILGGVAAVAFSVPGTGGAATNTTYSMTVSGTDMVTLDPRTAPVFVDGGGVQATFAGNNSTAEGSAYFEVHLDLPVGAKVTSIAISYAAGARYGAGTFVFGSYAPSTRATAPVFTVHPSPGTPRTFTKTGNPITTIAGGRRYVLDWDHRDFVASNISSLYPTFYGATAKYTCTAPCVP